MSIRQKFNFKCFVMGSLLIISAAFSQTPQIPAWNGQVLIDCEKPQNWTVEKDQGASGTITIVTGFINNAIQFNWNLGTGQWIQAKYSFPQPVDLSQKDIFGISLFGSTGTPNQVSLMFTDVNGVFYGLNVDGLNVIDRWFKNLPFPKKMFYYFFTIGPDPNRKTIDWSKIDRFFVVVKRPAPEKGGGSGNLKIDHLQADQAASWPRQTEFTSILPDANAKNRAVNYLLGQQMASGLFRSWKEEPDPKAHLYDQALTLIVLTREGVWQNGTPQNSPAQKAQKLVQFLIKVQKSDGHWARTWHPTTGAELSDDKWVGDQAWWIIALSEYIRKSGDALAIASLDKGTNWLEKQVTSSGKVVPSTEGTVDTWWAMILTKNYDRANLIKKYLLTQVWDADLKYWWRGLSDYPDPGIAMDAATWVGEFARTNRVNRPDMAHAALSFVRRTLLTTDNSGNLIGLDGQGPLSVWCEGTAQYISAGGQDAPYFLTMLLSLQRADGGMPCSPDHWPNDPFGWLSSWTGLAPTAWLYFALTKSPFPTDFVNAVENPANKSVAHDEFILQDPFPNPFNASTQIRYFLPQDSRILLTVYDISGREVIRLLDTFQGSGWHSAVVKGDNLSSGVYFCQLRAGNSLKVQKLILQR